MRAPSTYRPFRRAPFWLVSGALATVLLASTAPSPLYAIYQKEWHFNSATLMVVFAVYAVSLLASLLCFGRLSDHVGRRPVTIIALLITGAAMVVFLTAGGVTSLVVARSLQGVGAGLAIAAASSGLLDFERPGSGHGALAGTVVPGSAMAVGSLGSAALVQWAPHPTRLIWIVLIVLIATAVVGMLVAPEGVERRPGVIRSIRPMVAIGAGNRSVFIRTVPGLVAIWALSAFFLALGPELMVLLSGSHDVVLDTLAVALLTGSGSLASPCFRTQPPARTTRTGLLALLVGVATLLLALAGSSPFLLLVGSGVAGVGWGLSYLGFSGTLTSRTNRARRAGMLRASPWSRTRRSASRRSQQASPSTPTGWPSPR